MFCEPQLKLLTFLSLITVDSNIHERFFEKFKIILLSIHFYECTIIIRIIKNIFVLSI